MSSPPSPGFFLVDAADPWLTPAATDIFLECDDALEATLIFLAVVGATWSLVRDTFRCGMLPFVVDAVGDFVVDCGAFFLPPADVIRDELDDALGDFLVRVLIL